jgi:hypothetical protein
MNADPRAGRRKALTALLTSHFDRELEHDDAKAAASLIVGEAIQLLVNIERIAASLEAIADAVEKGAPRSA